MICNIKTVCSCCQTGQEVAYRWAIWKPASRPSGLKVLTSAALVLCTATKNNLCSIRRRKVANCLAWVPLILFRKRIISCRDLQAVEFLYGFVAQEKPGMNAAWLLRSFLKQWKVLSGDAPVTGQKWLCTINLWQGLKYSSKWGGNEFNLNGRVSL